MRVLKYYVEIAYVVMMAAYALGPNRHQAINIHHADTIVTIVSHESMRSGDYMPSSHLKHRIP